MKLFKFKRRQTREQQIVTTMNAHGIDTVIDIGANKGQTRDALRKAGYNGNIISLEPIPSLQPLLLEKSKADSRWTILPPLALGDNDNECEINVSAAPDMSSLLGSTAALLAAFPKTRVTETVKVPMKTLDALYDSLNLQGKKVFIKIDTQGYEMPILRSGPKALQSAIGLQIEMSLFELYKGETLFDDIIAFLKDKGFRPHMLFEISFSRTLKRQLQIDGIFYKD